MHLPVDLKQRIADLRKSKTTLTYVEALTELLDELEQFRAEVGGKGGKA